MEKEHAFSNPRNPEGNGEVVHADEAEEVNGYIDIEESFGSHRWSKVCRLCCPCAPEWVVEEFPELFSLSWSMMLLSLMGFLQEPMSLAFCGHLGTDILAGVAIATTVINVAGISVGIGLATACDTFFAQSFGSVNKKMMGVYLIKGMMIIPMFSFPCWALYLNVENLLLAVGQEAKVARIAGEYILWFMPALPAVFTQEIFFQYLRCQNIVAPTVVIGALGLGVCALFHYIFLYVLNWGFIGSSIAQLICYYTMAILLILYTLISKAYKPTWAGWTVEAFYEWGAFLKLAVAGFLMMGLEWWCYEIAIIMAGLIGPVPLAAQSISIQMLSMAYMLPLGIGLACNIRVGQMLGAEKPLRAKRVTKLGLTMAMCSAICIGIVIAAASTVLPYIFTSDIEVIDTASNILLAVAVLTFLICIGGVYTGIIRGCGRQGVGAAVILVSYYLIGLPVGISLMFLTSLGATGFIVGLCAGVFFEIIIFTTMVYRTDWEGETKKAQVRTGTADMTDEEKVALLDNEARAPSYTERRKSEQESGSEGSERRPSLRIRRRSSVIYSPYVSSSQVNLVDSNLYRNKDKPSAMFLVVTRLLFVLAMVLVFVAGLLVRLSLPTSHTTVTNATELCLPVNSTTWNSTLPLCNFTVVTRS